MSNQRRYGCIRSNIDGTEYIWNIPMEVLPKEYSYISIMPPIQDQGSDYKCVCYTLTAYLDWKVNKAKGSNRSNNFDINKLYSIRSDKTANGMMLKEGLHYLLHTGLDNVKIKKYAKVNSEHHLKCALISNGPCAAGILVKDSSRNDFWNGTKIEGGHAILIIGYNKSGFIIRNSWGTSFGNKGYVILPYNDFNKLLEIWTMI